MSAVLNITRQQPKELRVFGRQAVQTRINYFKTSPKSLLYFMTENGICLFVSNVVYVNGS